MFNHQFNFFFNIHSITKYQEEKTAKDFKISALLPENLPHA